MCQNDEKSVMQKWGRLEGRGTFFSKWNYWLELPRNIKMYVWRDGYPEGGTHYSQIIKPLPFHSPTDFSCFRKKKVEAPKIHGYRWPFDLKGCWRHIPFGWPVHFSVCS